MYFIIIWSNKDLKRLRERDPLLLEKLFKEYNDKVYTFLVIKAKGNKDVADEVFSETFHKAILYAPKLKNVNNLEAWLLQIARSKLYDYFRKENRVKELDDNMEKELTFEENVDEDLQKKEKIMMLNMAMENLRDNYKTILKLKYLEDNTQKDIAKILNKSESSVESLLFRAREALKKELKEISKEYFNGTE